MLQIFLHYRPLLLKTIVTTLLRTLGNFTAKQSICVKRSPSNTLQITKSNTALKNQLCS